MSTFLSDGLFQKYRDMIYAQSGIHFSESNRSILESRLRERLKLVQLEKVEDYLVLIQRDPEEVKVFLDSITTNLTRFFRNQAHYDTLINHVLPDIVAYKRKKGLKKITSWSAGCSTGEEPYTNAMVFKEHLPPDFDFEIVASDLSLKSLMKAKDGFYLSTRITDIPPEYLTKYMDKKEDGYVVKEELRKRIRFDYHNLKFDSGLRNLDIIFCRNVLIYFDEMAQKNVVNKFYDAMTDHSFLFIGHSESLFGMETKFQFIKTDWACIYGKITDN
jgi:chemotaxis protein methyltransferase CheR